MGVVPEMARSPYLGMILEGIKLLRCFPRGYLVLLGFGLRFELLKQVIPLSENVLIIVVRI